MRGAAASKRNGTASRQIAKVVSAVIVEHWNDSPAERTVGSPLDKRRKNGCGKYKYS